jgi:hypothetical protein
VLTAIRLTAFIGLVLATSAEVAAQRPAPTPSAPPNVAAPNTRPAVQFQCPANGTKVRYKDEHQIYGYESLGPAADDPTLCRSKSGMWSTNELFFGQISRNITVGLDEVKAGFHDLFTGRKTEFSVQTSGLSVDGTRNEYDNLWTRLADEPVSVAGRSITAVVIRHEQQSPRFAGQSSQTLWYDPQTGVWVKRQVSAAPGNRWGTSWEVFQIAR